MVPCRVRTGPLRISKGQTRQKGLLASNCTSVGLMPRSRIVR
jgi:hypothetical protein